MEQMFLKKMQCFYPSRRKVCKDPFLDFQGIVWQKPKKTKLNILDISQVKWGRQDILSRDLSPQSSSCLKWTGFKKHLTLSRFPYWVLSTPKESRPTAEFIITFNTHKIHTNKDFFIY